MTEYDNTNSGALFKNDRKEKATHPDYRGNLEVKCPCCNEVNDFWMSAWLKEAGPKARNPGQKFMSIAIQPKEPKEDPAPAEIGEDDIPF